MRITIVVMQEWLKRRITSLNVSQEKSYKIWAIISRIFETPMTMTICVDSSRNSAFIAASNMDGAENKREKHQPKKFQIHLEVGWINYLHHCIVWWSSITRTIGITIVTLVYRIRSCKFRACTQDLGSINHLRFFPFPFFFFVAELLWEMWFRVFMWNMCQLNRHFSETVLMWK